MKPSGFACERLAAGRVRSVTRLALAACLGLLPSVIGATEGAVRPVGMVLQLEGIAGGSTLPDHEGWIRLEQWDWNLTGSPAAAATPSGSSVGLSTVSFRKRVDKSSPLLAQAQAGSTKVPRARVEFYTLSDAGKVARFYEVLLENVQISSYELLGGDLSGDSVLTERISLDFERVEWTYTQFFTDGRPLADFRAFWDFVQDEGGYERIRQGFKVSAVTEIGRHGIRLRWLAENGRKYRILRSNLLKGDFTPVVPELTSTTDGDQELWVPREGPFGFFIITEVNEDGAP